LLELSRAFGALSYHNSLPGALPRVNNDAAPLALDPNVERKWLKQSQKRLPAVAAIRHYADFSAKGATPISAWGKAPGFVIRNVNER
jgi:hypothetical protein